MESESSESSLTLSSSKNLSVDKRVLKERTHDNDDDSCKEPQPITTEKLEVKVQDIERDNDNIPKKEINMRHPEVKNVVASQQTKQQYPIMQRPRKNCNFKPKTYRNEFWENVKYKVKRCLFELDVLKLL